jgi:hypothetical protein
MEDPVEAGAHQEDDVGVLQGQGAGRRHRQRMVVGHHPLAHRRAQERHLRLLDKGAHLAFGVGPGHPLADQDQRPLGPLEHVERRLDILRRGLKARRVGAFLHLHHVLLVALAGDDVVRHVEIGRTRPAVGRVAGRLRHIKRDALYAIDGVGEFAERSCEQHLALFLEGAHAAAIGFRGAADQDHRPAILLRIGKPGEAVHDAGSGHDDAGAGPPGQIAVGTGGIGGGLLVPHADIGDTLLLRRRGDRPDREPDHAEQMVDPLLLQAPRDQGGAVDFSHVFLLW